MVSSVCSDDSISNQTKTWAEINECSPVNGWLLAVIFMRKQKTFMNTGSKNLVVIRLV
jgi:hypothetical protein